MGIVIPRAHRDGTASARCIWRSGNAVAPYRSAAVDLADRGREPGSTL
jgi:hypothetical protein